MISLGACGAEAPAPIDPGPALAPPAFGDPRAMSAPPPPAALAPASVPTASPASLPAPTASPSAPSAPEAGEEVPFSAGGTGHLDAKQIKDVLHQKMPVITACYSRAITTTPSLHGQFVARFRVEASGAVSRAETSGSTLNPAFLACVSDAVRSLQFPKPRGGYVEVVYPLDFESS